VISAVLYGRNDSYGYNLHKRGVLSLNCIAEVLDAPGDEIIFVDYNTPDDLPTFTEAVRDLLTPRARRLIRTLRVRPASHAAFAARTHLRCLESPARNAALRRSNPNNRWILSTNTDMVFVPRGGRSLSQIAAALPDGFYHTARFEVPEVLWEALDRTAPRACIETIADWGRRFQLNEIVYGARETLFDGPGDFQLFLRDDGFRIDGFDERMLLGWHVDTNVAKRLSLLRGEPVRSALEHVFAYHCDHNRESTPAHAYGGTQNSWQRFVTDVARCDIPDQRHAWGFADETLEEIRVDSPPAVLCALEAIVPPMGDAPYVTGITANLSDLRYDPEHVIPYVANAIASLPRSWNVGYAGCRAKTFELFAALWQRLGFTGKILIRCGDPLPRSRESAASVEVLDAPAVDARADFFLFEFGAGRDDDAPRPTGERTKPEEGYEPLSPDDYLRVLAVHRAYARALAAEHARTDLPARRFLLINMQNNVLRRTATWRIGAAATPIGTRLTHGFALRDPFAPAPADPLAWLESRLRRVCPSGRDLLEGVLGALRSGRDAPELERLGPIVADVIGVLRSPDAPDALGVSRERLVAFVSALQARRFSQRARDERGLAAHERVPPRRGLSRIAALEDFDDPAWGAWAVRAWGAAPVQNRFLRLRPVWESTHVLFALDRCGVLEGATLFLAHPCEGAPMSQSLAGVLADWAGACSIADITAGFPADARCDAVVVSPAATLAAGIEHVPAVFRMADQALRVGGVCVLITDVVVGARSLDGLDLESVTSDLFDTRIERETAWRLSKPFEAVLGAATLDCAAGGEAPHGLVRLDESGRIHVSCLLVYRKDGVTLPQAWERYHADFRRHACAGVVTVT
jgi:hypothetical protein